ncbi:MAG: site-specific DNA-methyltransferase [Deltaproteobacteria bacterium]|nr:site-specific DNA-methyltransferase [Deltaproteobacteria bacterium]
MANHKTKLELTWIGKENQPRLEPRILIEDPAKSCHAPFRVGDKDVFDNRLIFGDNLLALKALEWEFAGKIKCIYIDPPYNTGSAFTHYDDGVEHSLWLSLMRDRLEILRRLLAGDGSIWISIDDAEMPYLRVLMDEVFGRPCFIASNVWQKRYSRENREAIGDVHEYVLAYALDAETFKKTRNRIPIDEKSAAVYKNPNNDPKGRWRGIPMTAQGWRPNQMYPITTPSGVIHRPPEGRCWSTTEDNYKALLAEGRIWFGKNGDGQPNVIRYLTEVEGMVPWTWWPHDECGHTDEAKKEIHELFGKVDAFDTPKPERLLKRVLDIATSPGDWVLDSFAGSGTTGAVAHKMGRRWIMVELGEHCHTHIIPRLKQVIEGKDPGGITEAEGWKGGGGFRYYRMAPSLLQKDQFGNWVINRKYNAAMLTEAICKLEGFAYSPSDTVYWQHGRSTEKDFIYVTTQTLTREQVQKLSDEVGEGRSLLVMCGAFRVKNLDAFPNLTVKKIPKAVLSSCEWGKDDYSLEIKSLPMKPAEEESELVAPPSGKKPRTRAERRGQATLFDMTGKEGNE